MIACHLTVPSLTRPKIGTVVNMPLRSGVKIAKHAWSLQYTVEPSNGACGGPDPHPAAAAAATATADRVKNLFI